MPELPSMRFIREHVRAKRYRLTRHATTVRLERGITISAMERALLTGEIIERYPDDLPYPSCLVLGWLPTCNQAGWLRATHYMSFVREERPRKVRTLNQRC